MIKKRRMKKVSTIDGLACLMQEEFVGVNEKFDGIDKKFDAVDKKFDGVHAEFFPRP